MQQTANFQSCGPDNGQLSAVAENRLIPALAQAQINERQF